MSKLLDLINGPVASNQTGTFRVGSVNYVQTAHQEVNPADVPVALALKEKPKFANVQPQLHMNEPVQPPRYEDGRLADPHGNLQNLAAQGAQDDNRVIVINMVGEDTSEE